MSAQNRPSDLETEDNLNLQTKEFCLKLFRTGIFCVGFALLLVAAEFQKNHAYAISIPTFRAL